MSIEEITHNRKDSSLFFKLGGRLSQGLLYKRGEKKKPTGSLLESVTLLGLMHLYEGSDKYSYRKDMASSMERIQRLRGLRGGETSLAVYQKTHQVVPNGFINTEEGRKAEQEIERVLSKSYKKALKISDFSGIKGDENFNQRYQETESKEKFIENNLEFILDNLGDVEVKDKDVFIKEINAGNRTVNSILGNNLDNIEWKQDSGFFSQFASLISTDYDAAINQIPQVLKKKQGVFLEIDEELSRSEQSLNKEIASLEDEIEEIEKKYRKSVLELKKNLDYNNNESKDLQKLIDEKSGVILQLELGNFLQAKDLIGDIMENEGVEDENKDKIYLSIYIDLLKKNMSLKEELFLIYEDERKGGKRNDLLDKINKNEHRGGSVESIMEKIDEITNEYEKKIKKEVSAEMKEKRKKFVEGLKELDQEKRVEITRVTAKIDQLMYRYKAKIDIVARRKQSAEDALAAGDEILTKEQAGLIPHK